ncbi:HAD family hydrolase [Mucilaginibacter arboris]|uniref:HAD-IA family hydrolase n=1 Tax=Mucilaginibacter arboris TaxID=2682090 RepID=A0A7K1SYC1_9SPHI|nr:HAD-IA family hydrolase [Mucilaginibacter arboris]MVN22312.1 HAD-IA family hydrolase [Mucilaginibacter arboris]
MESGFRKFVFLDIGGVLLTNGWGHESRQLAAEKFGVDYQEMEVLHNLIFNIYEIGRITLDEYLDNVVFNKTRDFTREDFKSFMFSESKELPDLLQWLVEWKKDFPFKIFSLNNEGKELNDYRIKKFKLHRCFDGFISSCEVGMRKPDPGIFKIAMGITQASPEDCFYFDDRLMLAESARWTGMNSFQHIGFESTKKILEDIKSNQL